MDLRAVLVDGTDGLGHPVLAQYYRTVFARHCPAPAYDGSFRVRAALNFGVQQLATRSRISPDTEAYLQVGGLDAFDLPAALIHAMPHTRVVCLQPPDGTEAALVSLRNALPEDGMPDGIQIDIPDPAPASFGLIALFPSASERIDRWLPLLSPKGSLILIVSPEHGAPALISLHA